MDGQSKAADPASPKVSVVSPTYCVDITGTTKVILAAPGFTSAVVKCWKQGGQYGTDSTVATVTFDAEGNGAFTFPANEYPHGPVILRITATDGKITDVCNLQLYNTGGVVWNQGIPATPPPPAEGMKLVFQDDFAGPLSISADGAGATYCAHKPGGGDFGRIPFADPSGPGNPFSQVDSYLRIRVDANKRTAGLISSLRKDGTGITATVPCYFECRFVAQNAIGSWPAFWLMTKDVYQGLKKPADELDTIEAYGVTDLTHKNQTGYWITSHTWNQTEKPVGHIYTNVQMPPIGGGATWNMTFHTYGTKITPTDTIYYCDNIEVGRHATTTLCKTDPLFFFINFAVGGGWPVDLSRYNGIIDMYVDYVRVYKG